MFKVRINHKGLLVISISIYLFVAYSASFEVFLGLDLRSDLSSVLRSISIFLSIPFKFDLRLFTHTIIIIMPTMTK